MTEKTSKVGNGKTQDLNWPGVCQFMSDHNPLYIKTSEKTKFFKVINRELVNFVFSLNIFRPKNSGIHALPT